MMNNGQSSLKLCLYFVAALVLVACSNTVTVKPDQLQSKDVAFKSYNIGEEQTRILGEPVIRVKNYKSLIKIGNHLKPDRDFSIANEKEVFLKGKKDEPIGIYGNLQDGGKKYILVPSTVNWYGPLKYLIVFTEDGKFTGALALEKTLSTSIALQNAVRLLPESTKFSQLEEEQITGGDSGYTNFEIVFMGVNNDSISFVYKEYTRDTSEMPSHYSTFTYPAKSQYIRFKKVKIELISVNSEKISYIVRED